MDGGTANFARAVSYMHKMFMKLTAGGQWNGTTTFGIITLSFMTLDIKHSV